MKWILMFYVCSGGYDARCEWKEALVFQEQWECTNVLHGTQTFGTPLIRIGDGFLVARCKPQQSEVER